MSTEILNLGTVGILFFLFMKEFFSYLKTRKNGTGYKVELDSINNKLSNHLTHVNQDIETIKADIIETKTDIKIIKESLENIKIAIK